VAEEGDYPLLLLAAPVIVPPVERPAPRGGTQNPSKGVQVRRLDPQFLELQRVLDAQNAIVSAAPGGASPEHVLVFETNGPPKDFFETIAANPDLEWLVDHEDKVDPDEYFHAKDSKRQITACIYMVLFNQAAMRQLLSLWAIYKKGTMPDGYGAWSAVFRCLRTVRRWGPEDRLREAGALRGELDLDLSRENIPVEIEFWARSEAQRAVAEDRIARLVEASNGVILDRAFLPEIRYHALLAELPRQYLARLLASRDVDLIQADEIYLLRATPQCVTDVDTSVTSEGSASARKDVGGRPVCALLDGLPMENHPQLRGHLIVDDPDGWAARYPVASRKHGTAMASLIVHGDQADNLPALGTPIYVRPIIRAVGTDERAPQTRLWLDLIHQAVRRLVATDGPQPPVAPSVAIINLSVGDSGRPFTHEPSPLARLLDWLAWQHGLLFIVSAGNHATELPSGCLDDAPALEFVFRQSRQRKILSPAEATNAVTVGALAADSSPATPDATQRAVPTRPDLPAVYSALGRGVRRSVKPDLLAPGGRQLFRRMRPEADAPWIPSSFQHVGHVVAVPGAPGSKSTTRLSGTSNAAALTSRAAIVIHTAVEQLKGSPEGSHLRPIPTAVLVKALLVHTANWEDATLNFARNALNGLLDQSRGTDQLCGLLGYGALRSARGVICAPERATALGGGLLSNGQRAVHSFPIPECLHLHNAWRRLTATLAWFSPINAGDRRYRVARLQLEVPKDKQSPLLVKGGQAHADATLRGTVQHLVLERRRGVLDVAAETELKVAVTCSEDASPITTPIPYALAISVEVAPGTSVQVYQGIAERLRVQPRVAVR
jgi:Subtilase family